MVWVDPPIFPDHSFLDSSKQTDHELVPPTVSLTELNVLLALLPKAVMAVMHTTMINANMTAYSTAVGPSSFWRKLTTK